MVSAGETWKVPYLRIGYSPVVKTLLGDNRCRFTFSQDKKRRLNQCCPHTGQIVWIDKWNSIYQWINQLQKTQISPVPDGIGDLLLHGRQGQCMTSTRDIYKRREIFWNMKKNCYFSVCSSWFRLVVGAHLPCLLVCLSSYWA